MKAQETLTIPLTPSAIIARAAAGLGMTVSEYLNRTFGDILPPAIAELAKVAEEPLPDAEK